MKFAPQTAAIFTFLLLTAGTAPALASDPPYAKSLEKAERSLKRLDYSNAVTYFTQVLKQDPNVYEAYLGRASARAELGDSKGALKDYDAAIKANANVTDIYLKRGALQAKLGQKDAAVRDYSEVLLLDPKNTDALMLRGQALQENGDYAGAAADYDQYLKGNPSALAVRRQRAECNINNNKYDQVASDYQYILKKGGSKEFDVQYDWGEALRLSGDTKAANEHFNQAVTYYSRSIGHSQKKGLDYMYRGMAYFQLGDKAKALSDLSNALRLLPRNADVLAHLAHVQLANGDSAAALSNLNAAIEVNPRMQSALIDRASLRVSQGSYEEAKRDLDQALLTTRNADGLASRAMTLLAIGDVTSAVSDLTEATKLNPTLVESKRKELSQDTDKSAGKSGALEQAQGYSRLALYDLAAGDTESAERQVRQSIKLEQAAKQTSGSRAGINLLLLGHIYLKRNLPTQAEAMFRMAQTKLGQGDDGSQKYAVFSLEQCAKQLMAGSKLEEAGSILSDTRMLRASHGWTEQALSGEYSRKAEQALDAYKLKRKYDRQEDLVRLAATGNTTGNTGASTGAEESAGPSQAEINRPIRDKWALIVGTGRFKEPSINLRYAAKDAQDFSEFLIREQNFAPDHVQLLTNEAASRANILSLLGNKWLPRVAEKDDLVVIYFSTHGSPSSLDVGGVNYLVAYDTDPNDLYATGIAIQDLAHIIKERVHSDRIMLVLDACHSGGAGPSSSKALIKTANVDVERIAMGTGQLVISSSKPDQRSWESSRYEGSVFTHYLIEGFRSGGKNAKVGDACHFLETETQREVLRDRGVLQTPVMRCKWSGSDLILGAKPTAPSPGMGQIDLPDHFEQQTNKTVQNNPPPQAGVESHKRKGARRQ